MSAINTAVIEIVEAILLSQNRFEDNSAFSSLMDELMQHTDQFWTKYKDLIPKQHVGLFRKHS